MIKGIIFDFDGTLANTLPVIFACYDYSTEKILGKKVLEDLSDKSIR